MLVGRNEEAQDPYTHAKGFKIKMKKWMKRKKRQQGVLVNNNQKDAK